MTKNLDNEVLRSIVENYDFFFIDLWGVVHNGIKLHENAIETLNEGRVIDSPLTRTSPSRIRVEASLRLIFPINAIKRSSRSPSKES